MERGPVSNGVIQPVTEPVKTLSVTKRDVGNAAPGLNAEGVPPCGGEGGLPVHRECENGGWVKRKIAYLEGINQENSLV